MLIDTLLQSKLDKIRKKHDEKLAKMRLKNELKITENKLKNELRLQELESEKSQLSTKREIFTLDNLTKKDTDTVKSGHKIKFFALLTTLVSTGITIAGGYTDFNSSIYTLVTYVIAIIVLQLTVFLISAQETRIMQEFFRHYHKVIILKYCLLGISIYSNYRFFAKEVNSLIANIIIFVLCVALDLIAIYLVSLAFDQKTLTFSYQEDRPKVVNKNLLYKLAFNLTYGIVYKIESKYANNQNKIKKLSMKEEKILIELKEDKPEKQEVKQILEKNEQIAETQVVDPRHEDLEHEEKPDYKFKPDEPITINEIEAYFNYLLENSNNGKALGMKKIADGLGISQYKGQKITEELKDKGYLKSIDRQTMITKDKFDNKDFMELIEVA